MKMLARAMQQNFETRLGPVHVSFESSISHIVHESTITQLPPGFSQQDLGSRQLRLDHKR